jgi:hypothetical protein
MDDRQKRSFYQRGLITQAIGGRGEPKVHVGEVEVVPGDRVLLCSDGIHDNLTEREIVALLRKGGRRGNSGDVLVHEARKRSQRGALATLRSKPDDMSAIVVEVVAVREEAAPRGKKQTGRKGQRTAKAGAARRREAGKTGGKAAGQVASGKIASGKVAPDAPSNGAAVMPGAGKPTPKRTAAKAGTPKQGE